MSKILKWFKVDEELEIDEDGDSSYCIYVPYKGKIEPVGRIYRPDIFGVEPGDRVLATFNKLDKEGAA